MLPEQAAIWSYPRTNETNSTIAGNMVNAMLLRMHLSGEITTLTKEQFAIVKEGVACYKRIRKDIPEAVPFYPLGIETVNREWLCTGYRCREKTYLVVWRLDSEEECKSIHLEGDINEVKVVYPANDNSEIRYTKNDIEVVLHDKFSAVILIKK